MSASALTADSSIFSLVDSGDYFGDEEMAAMFSVVAIDVEDDNVDDSDDINKLENFFQLIVIPQVVMETWLQCSLLQPLMILVVMRNPWLPTC